MWNEDEGMIESQNGNMVSVTIGVSSESDSKEEVRRVFAK